jgi:hypothetical protein
MKNNVFPAKETLDHFVMVRIHARQLSSPRADPLAIWSVQKRHGKNAVIWLLSGFEVQLAKLNGYVRITPHGLALSATRNSATLEPAGAARVRIAIMLDP